MTIRRMELEGEASLWRELDRDGVLKVRCTAAGEGSAAGAALGSLPGYRAGVASAAGFAGGALCRAGGWDRGLLSLRAVRALLALGDRSLRSAEPACEGENMTCRCPEALEAAEGDCSGDSTRVSVSGLSWMSGCF